MAKTRKQTQVLVDVVLILDDEDEATEQEAYERLASAILSIDESSFVVNGVLKVEEISI